MNPDSLRTTGAIRIGDSDRIRAIAEKSPARFAQHIRVPVLLHARYRRLRRADQPVAARWHALKAAGRPYQLIDCSKAKITG